MTLPPDLGADRFISDIYLNLASQSEDPVTRTLALDHAARVDAKYGDGHEFGREVLQGVFGRALRTYLIRTSIYVPGEDETGVGVEHENLGSERNLKVAESVIRAFGAPEGGVTIERADSSDPESGQTAVASYDLSVPGMGYLMTAVDVIAWPRASTLFI
jgi:GGDEF domain-containing protein